MTDKKHGKVLRVDHRDELLEEIQESARREKRRDRRWKQSQKIWGTAAATMITAAILAGIFMMVVTVNALYDIEKISLHIDTTIVWISGLSMLAFAVAGVIQIILAKIWEGR